MKFQSFEGASTLDIKFVWCLSSKDRNRLAHLTNGNTTRDLSSSDRQLTKVAKDLEERDNEIKALRKELGGLRRDNSRMET